MIYGIEGEGPDVEEICRFDNIQRTLAESWASGEQFDGDNFSVRPGVRRLFQAPPHWTFPESREASNPLAHLARAIERDCTPVEDAS